MTYEELKEEYEEEINIVEHPLHENKLLRDKGCKGLYINTGNANILIDNNLTNVEKKCVLAEEIGHHLTSSGNIINTNTWAKKKQEKAARTWGAKKLIDKDKLEKAIGIYGFDNLESISQELEVIPETIEDYLDYAATNGIKVKGLFSFVFYYDNEGNYIENNNE